jgi:hypothetical protein
MYIVPGGVEIHVHGGGGRDFMEGTEEAFRVAVKAHMPSLFPLNGYIWRNHALHVIPG